MVGRTEITQNGVQNYDILSGDSSLRGGVCIGLLHMLVLRKAIEQNGAQNAPRFLARKCRNHRTSVENTQKMTGKLQNGAERRTARFRNEDEKPSGEVGIREG